MGTSIPHLETSTPYLETLIPYFAIIALIISFIALFLNWRDHQLNKAQFKKIEQDSKEADDLAINPSWFVEAMSSEYWTFGLVTQQGHIIAVNKINSISKNGKWLEVSLLTDGELTLLGDQIPPESKFFYAPDKADRVASIQVSNIVMALTLQSRKILDEPAVNPDGSLWTKPKQ